MILYAASQIEESLRDFVAGPGAAVLARAAQEGACYVRFATSSQPTADLQRLLANFRERFGGPPAANS